MPSIKTIVLRATLIASTLVFLCYFLFSLVDYQRSLSHEIEKSLMLQSRNEAAALEKTLDSFSSTTLSFSRVLESSSSSHLNQEQLLAMQRTLFEDKDAVYGWGFWFEPYQYDPKLKYFGPYVIHHGKGGQLELTWIYNTEKYNYFGWDWYQIPLNSHRPYAWSKPFYDPDSGVTMMTVGSAFQWQGRKAGVATADIDMDYFKKYASMIQVGKKGYAFVFDGSGHFLGDSRVIDRLGLERNTSFMRRLRSTQTVQYFSSVKLDSSVYLAAVAPVGDTVLKMVLVIPEAELFATRNQVLLKSLFFFLAAVLALAIILSRLMQRIVSRPFDELVSLLDQIAAGNLTAKVKFGQNRLRETDTLLQAVDEMQREIFSLFQNLNEKTAMIRENHEEIASLYEQASAMNEELRQLLNEKKTLVDELQQSYLSMVRALANAIEAKDVYTKGHCERVSAYAVALGRCRGLTDEELLTLKIAGLLHDIGKIAVPAIVLNKTEKLRPEEFDLIKSHPEAGYHILEGIPFLDRTCKIIRQHHERMDGHGYPQGLSESDIDPLARILTVCDSFDAMTTSRPYRLAAMSTQQAFQELTDHSGTQFDRELVPLFIECFTRNPALIKPKSFPPGI